MNSPEPEAISRSQSIDIEPRDITTTQPRTPHTRELVPELAPITDLDQIGPTIHSVLGMFGLIAIAEPTLEHVRHRTHKPRKVHQDWMSASWRCAVDGDDAIVVLRARRDGSSRREYDQWQRDGVDPRGIAHLPPLDATAWLFPHDPALPRLAELTDPAGTVALLDRLAIDIGGADRSKLSSDVVHYYPEQRCTLHISWSAPADGRTRSVYIKAFRTVAQAIRLDENCRAFRAARRAPAFAAPVPLGADRQLAAVAFAGVPHADFAGQLTTSSASALLEDCGRRIAGFHGTQLDTGRTISLDDQLAEIEDKLEKLTMAAPTLSEITSRLRALLRDERPTPDPAMTVTHGDLHLRQVGVASSEDLVLFDFDEMCTADPARDLASFLVSLRTDPTTTSIGGLTAPFLAGYAGVDTIPDSLPWQVRVQLATKAYRAFRSHRPNAQTQAKRLLDHAVAPDLAAEYELSSAPEGGPS